MRWIAPVAFGVVVSFLGAACGCVQNRGSTAERVFTFAQEYNAQNRRLHLRWIGDPKDLRVSVGLENAGATAVYVDRELVFLLEVTVLTVDGQPIALENVTSVARPSSEGVRARIVELDPGETLERVVDLKRGFKCFEWEWPNTDPASVMSWEAVRRVPPDAHVGAVMVRYYGQWEGLPSFPRTSAAKAEPIRSMNYNLPPELLRSPLFSDVLDVPGTKAGAGQAG